MASFDYSRSNKRWQQLRKLALRRDKRRCREAARYGKAETATVVHHIWPAEDYPEYAYCLWNLVSLSLSAHDAMHDRITRKLTALGLAWKNRTPPPPARRNRGAYSWAGNSFHTQRKFFRSGKTRSGIKNTQAHTCPRTRAQGTDAIHGHNARR